MNNHEKWSETYSKYFGFGSPQLGIGVFFFPFLPLIFASIHLGYLAFLPLGIFASYAIIDTTEKLKFLITGSKSFQKKLVWCSFVNIFAIIFHPVFGGVVALSLALYLHLSAPKAYAKLEET